MVLTKEKQRSAVNLPLSRSWRVDCLLLMRHLQLRRKVECLRGGSNQQEEEGEELPGEDLRDCGREDNTTMDKEIEVQTSIAEKSLFLLSENGSARSGGAEQNVLRRQTFSSVTF